MVMHMSGLPPLLFIALMLVAGCLSSAPEDAPPPVVTTGTLEVSSSPPGAEVYLDTVYRGTTPVTVIGEPGPHALELRLRDYQPWTKSLVIESGARGYVDTVLVPVPAVISPTATLPATRTATLPTTRAQPVTTLATTSPAPTVPTPWPRLILGCFGYETEAWTVKGESLHLTEIWWFQPAGVGLINDTWIYAPPKKPELSLTGFTWSRDPATDLVSVSLVGGGPPAEVHYNGNNDTITFSNSNMRPTIFPRVACWT
jgi:hypothetical protein